MIHTHPDKDLLLAIKQFHEAGHLTGLDQIRRWLEEYDVPNKYSTYHSIA